MKILASLIILVGIIFAVSQKEDVTIKTQNKIEIKKQVQTNKTIKTVNKEELTLENQIEKYYDKPPYDLRLDVDSNSRDWYANADDDEAASYNIGHIYRKELKDFEKAEFWYKKALSMEKNTATIISLGLLYEDIKKIDKSIFFYKKAYELKDKSGAYNLAYLYVNLKKYNEAVIWYKKAIAMKKIKALENLAILYHNNLKDDVQAVKYYIALADKKYPKDKLISSFKNAWNLSDETIKKGYEAQLQAKDIPESMKYKGGI
jgi:TPR repeat protein